MPAPASESAVQPETNPLRCEMPADPCAIVIFGASGDLTKRKLIPALYDLAANACLAPRFAIVGCARTAMSDDEFRRLCADAVRDSPETRTPGEAQWGEFAKNVSYVGGNYDHPEAYKKLAQRLEEMDKKYKLQGNRLFYLATPPGAYANIIEQLGQAGLARPQSDHSWARIIIEKPFGSDRESAAKLNQTVLGVFKEKQVYRIDHYLGKETVQNLLVFRFGNGIFEPLWNRNYVDHVQITAAETLGVEHRAAFYDNTGALRDMIQSHMLQLASLVAMEPPATFDATAVRNEKLKVLQSIPPRSTEQIDREVVRGQYGPGKSEGKEVPGYREEPDVHKNSATETFVAEKLLIDNWRWAGVPFYLRTGKRLPRRVTEIAIQFRRAPHIVFREKNVEPNWLVLNIQPDEGITLSFSAKLPGAEMAIKSVTMDFCYRTAFGPGSPSAYSTLINDCMRGDATLFDRGDNVEAAWALVDPVLDCWINAPAPRFPNYAAGTWGPAESDQLLENDGRHWRNP
ncbi:MAG TPA: glucose-6-phosphate dehydrogenase [Candidatus Acidoferrales bacterium]|nr:glucose-6-phosphate dehydrogenase [Candidatus Acidoferrales bacterium]